jgi:hypothetical protein
VRPDHLVDRLATLLAGVDRLRTEALALGESGRVGGELLYELDVTRQRLRRAAALARELGGA